MSLIGIIIAIVVVGILLWLTSLIPMDALVRKVLQVTVVIVLVVWVLKAFGLLAYLGSIHI